jgi:hypothetical protein
MSVYDELFDDERVVKLVQDKLPHLFQLAELESQRNGKVGMEVGSTREKVLIALLMYKFGLENVDADIPITEPETDVVVKNEPLSIKTVTTSNDSWSGGVKLIWTVDAEKAQEFSKKYQPSCDILLTKIQWGGIGKLYLFTKEAQREILSEIGPDRYLKLPKPGTNPRGVEISKEALELLSEHETTRKIEILFEKEAIGYNAVYAKWLSAWREA